MRTDEQARQEADQDHRINRLGALEDEEDEEDGDKGDDHDDHDAERPAPRAPATTTRAAPTATGATGATGIRRCCRTASSRRRHRAYQLPAIYWAACGLIFGALSAVGVLLCRYRIDAEEADVRQQAETVAKEVGVQISDQISLSVLSLFTLGQFATELPSFEELAAQIGPAHKPGSLPFSNDPTGKPIAT